MTTADVQLVLLVGAPRSGTTWLQSMLGSRPEIATPQETDLFTRYVQPLHDAWSWQLRGTPDDWRSRRFKGLPGLLSADEFRDLVRRGVDRVLEGVLKLAPEARIVVEKSPAHSLCAEVVAEYVPHARVVHLVRDGRDVVASLTAAGATWGRRWAPADVTDAARSWVRHVQGARDYRLIGFPYREVRYETLVDGDAALLASVFEFVGLDVDPAECARIYDRHLLDRMRADAHGSPILLGGEFAPYADSYAEPAGFYGAGGSGWRERWDARDRLRVHEVAGAELARLGYAPDGRWAAGPARTAAFLAEESARRALGRVARRIGRAGRPSGGAGTGGRRS
jgi:hypothetical protein